MPSKYSSVLLYCVFALAACSAVAFDIPHTAGATIDGNLAEWAPEAFSIHVFTDKEGRIVPPDDLRPKLFLAWDDSGILIGLDVQDDIAFEQGDESTMWDGDSIELFLSDAVGSENMLHLVLSPGISDAFPAIRQKAYGFRTGPTAHDPIVDVARERTASGYTLEAHVAFASLGADFQRGDELGFQVFLNDMDGPVGRYQAIWYPQTRTHEHADRVHPITLSRNAGDPVLVRTRAGYDAFARGYVDMVAAPEWMGRDAIAKADGDTVATDTLEAEQGWAVANLRFPFPPPDRPLDTLDLRVGRERLSEIELPDAGEIRARKLLDIELAFDRYIFTGTAFPSCDFRNPLLAENIMGTYAIDVVFFDAAFEPVERANDVGRYGAVITVAPDNAPAFTRYQTLFRAPEAFAQYGWLHVEHDNTATWPPGLGLPDAAVAKQHDAISSYLANNLRVSYRNDEKLAVLLAGIVEDTTDGPTRTVADDAFARDRQWWVTFKRIRNGNAERYPSGFVAPRPIEGAPAPTLHAGTPEEAAMNPGVVETLDNVLEEWWEKSQEPFATCIARDGVVFYRKAFGERNGTAMTLERPSWMASISKLMSGTLMMMLVDQGLVDLDATVDTYLPALRDIPVETPLTIRHLYTHTNGFMLDGLTYLGAYPDHWGDHLNDLEEIVAGYYPRLKVGHAHGYNGVGYAIGGKVIEQVSGEALPQFYKRHLLDPLGMTHTAAADTCGFIFSTPDDIAAWAQMLLNKGAYGRNRFFSEATFEKMKPQSLEPLLGPGTDLEWGIGMVWMPEPGLSPKTFGHGAASAATLRIDPDNNLVIVMTRNNAGSHYWEYHPKFIKAITDNLVP